MFHRHGGRVAAVASAGVLALGVAACGDDDNTGNAAATTSNGAAMQTMKVVEQGAASNLPIYVADAQGYLKDAGIKLDTVEIKAGAAELVAALQSKAADVIIQTPLTLQSAVRQGVKASFFMGMGNADADLIVPAKDKSTPAAADGDWKATIAALKGKTIGTSVRGSTTGAVYEGVFRAGKTDATFTVSGPGPQSLAALRSGQVDAIVADSLATANSVAEGIGRDVMNIGAGEGPEGYGDWMQIGAIARNDAMADNPEKFEKFAGAVAKAVEFMKQAGNAAAVQQVVEKQYGLKPDAAKIIAEQRVKVYDATVPKEKIDATLKLFGDIGLYEGSALSYGQLVHQLPGLPELYK